MEYVIYSLGGLVILGTVLPLWQTTYWWVRIWDFPRFQIFIVGFVTLAAAIFFLLPLSWGDIFLAMAIIGCLAVQFSYIFPYTILRPVQQKRERHPQEERTISVITSNVRYGSHKFDKLISLIRKHKPDMFILLEPGEAWLEPLKVLEDEFPYSVKHPLENTYGILLYSRLKLIDPEVRFLMKEGIPSIHSDVELRCGEHIRYIALHPEPPAPWDQHTDERDDELCRAATLARQSDKPFLVAGDLNDVAWSPSTKHFMRKSGLLDPRIGRGFFNTYNAFVPFFRYPIDHIFCSPQMRLVKIRKLPFIGSDHYPLYFKLALPPKGED